MRRPKAAVRGLLIFLCAIGPGCALREKIHVTSAGALDYQRLSVIYDVRDSGTIEPGQPPVLQPVSHFSRCDEESSPASGRMRLEIEYPYAGVNAEFARVKLQPISTAPESIRESLVLDLPKTQLDALIYDLAHDGFFDHARAGSNDALLRVTYNGGRVERRWNREPRLDDLIDLLKRCGTPTTP